VVFVLLAIETAAGAVEGKRFGTDTFVPLVAQDAGALAGDRGRTFVLLALPITPVPAFRGAASLVVVRTVLATLRPAPAVTGLLGTTLL